MEYIPPPLSPALNTNSHWKNKGIFPQHKTKNVLIFTKCTLVILVLDSPLYYVLVKWAKTLVALFIYFAFSSVIPEYENVNLKSKLYSKVDHITFPEIDQFIRPGGIEFHWIPCDSQQGQIVEYQPNRLLEQSCTDPTIVCQFHNPLVIH